MKKGIIAVSLLLSGVLFMAPVTNAITCNKTQEVKIEAVKANANTVSSKITKKVNKSTKAAKSSSNKNTSKKATKKTTNKKTTTKKAVAKKTIKSSNKIATTVAKTEAVKLEEMNTENKEQENTGMSQKEAEAILNKYIAEVEKADFTYTYQGDENIFEAIKDKGIKGYVFLPDIETDLAYLVDKDNGNIYNFHPSGYFELLQK